MGYIDGWATWLASEYVRPYVKNLDKSDLDVQLRKGKKLDT
jgi:hypothetical protein